jgi:hypothetical protein
LVERWHMEVMLSVPAYGAVSRVLATEGPKTLDFWLVTHEEAAANPG